MRRIIARLLVCGMLMGYGFWVYNSSTGGLYAETGFQYLGDCQKTQAWVQAMQPSPTPTGSPAPTPTGLSLSSCYSMTN